MPVISILDSIRRMNKHWLSLGFLAKVLAFHPHTSFLLGLSVLVRSFLSSLKSSDTGTNAVDPHVFTLHFKERTSFRHVLSAILCINMIGVPDVLQFHLHGGTHYDWAD